jgi:hypothetical protein
LWITPESDSSEEIHKTESAIRTAKLIRAAEVETQKEIVKRVKHKAYEYKRKERKRKKTPVGKSAEEAVSPC